MKKTSGPQTLVVIISYVSVFSYVFVSSCSLPNTLNNFWFNSPLVSNLWISLNYLVMKFTTYIPSDSFTRIKGKHFLGSLSGYFPVKGVFKYFLERFTAVMQSDPSLLFLLNQPNDFFFLFHVKYLHLSQSKQRYLSWPILTSSLILLSFVIGFLLNFQNDYFTDFES